MIELDHSAIQFDIRTPAGPCHCVFIYNFILSFQLRDLKSHEIVRASAFHVKRKKTKDGFFKNSLYYVKSHLFPNIY